MMNDVYKGPDMDCNYQDNVGDKDALKDIASPELAPWEQIEDGRYRPRRIRGSYHGRELG